MANRWGAVGAFLMALGVAAGAFAAHALKARLAPDKLIIFEKAVFYHFIHAFGILAVAIFCQTSLISGEQSKYVGLIFLSGILLFSGSLYLYSILETHWLVFLTPIGGTMFIAGWLLFSYYIWSSGS